MQAMQHRELDEHGLDVVAGLRNVRAELKALLAVESDLKAQLLAVLDGAEVGMSGGEPVVIAESTIRDSFDIKRARQSPIYADMINGCMRSVAYCTVRLV